MSRKPRADLDAVSEARFLKWIWRACGLNGWSPGSLQECELEHWAQLDEVRPLVVPWCRALITCEAFEVKRALWDSDAKSPIVDVLDSMKHGVAIVCEKAQQNAKGLLVLYLNTEEVDVLSIDADDPVTIIHPAWGVSCERLMSKSK